MRCFAFLFFFHTLFGGCVDLSPFLTKVGCDLQPSGIEGIDCIYVINLDERPLRWVRINSILSDWCLVGNRFCAINGWRLRHKKALRELTVFGHKYKNNFSSCFSWGSLGCYLSHLSILKDAYERGYERIWVLEDDIVIKQDPCSIVRTLECLNRIDFKV